MNQTGYPCKGPSCFGTSRRTSFVDVRDDDIPGPGQHNSSRIDRKTPTKWKFGTSTERDSFLDKFPRAYPSPQDYRPNPEPTMTAHPGYSIPLSEEVNPAGYKGDDVCTVNYRPNTNFGRHSNPKYSFGYTQQMSYSTAVPAPNTYRIDRNKSEKKQFNKTQSFFNNANRPAPYDYNQQGKNPGVGLYEVNSKDPMNATAHCFGTGDRPNILNGPDAPGVFYEIAKEMKQPGAGFTMRPFYEGVKNKQTESFPAPNHYNPRELESKKKIITFTGQRSELYQKDLITYPSPQKHVTSPEFYKSKKSQSFKKQKRYEFEADKNPGPGNYQVVKDLNTVKGYMGRKIKDLPEFVTPGADEYHPSQTLTKPNPQRVINYQTKRTDFSKSITGVIGPGVYMIEKDEQVRARSELGKMSKTDKFGKNRNKNPGPGDYEIPTSIGKLPRYYCAPKKLTTTGFSTFTIAMNQKTQRMQQMMHQKEQAKKKEEEERKLKEESEQK